MDGRGVSLRPLALPDAESVLEWRRGPRIAAQLFSERPPERAAHLQWVATLPDRRDRREFVIVLDGDTPVGTVGLSHIDPIGGEAEYGILIGRSDVCGRGVAYEASRLILRYAFEELSLRRVVLNLFADNAPARKLYDRLGFAEDPARAGTHMRDGVARHTTFMSLDRPSWLRTSARTPPLHHRDHPC